MLVSSTQQDFVPQPLAPGTPTLWSHFKTGIETTLYDLPMQNIERAVMLGHYNLPQAEGYTMSAEEANNKFGIDGHVSFDGDINYFKAKLIHDYKQAELERMQMLELGNTTLFRKSVFFTSGFVGQALDPINLASMFIPVVSDARFAQLAAKFGMTKARLLAGGIEAAVGSAMIEPMSYLSKAVGEQNIYGPQDTIMNLTVGTIFGAGLRAGGGFLGDLVSARFKPVLEARSKGQKIKLDAEQSRIVKQAEISAKTAGLKEGTPIYEDHVIGQIVLQDKLHAEEMVKIQTALNSADATTHRLAFEEGLNNLLNDEPMVGPSIALQLDDIRKVVADSHRAWVVAKEAIEEVVENIDGRPTTKLKLNKATVSVLDEGDAIHIKIDEAGTPDDLNAIVYGKAKQALAEQRDLYVDDIRFDREALDVFVNGDRALTSKPIKLKDTTTQNKENWRKVDISDEHLNTVDSDTPDKILMELERDIAELEQTYSAADIEQMIVDFPEDMQAKILEDYTALDRVDDEVNGIKAVVDCIIRKMT